MSSDKVYECKYPVNENSNNEPDFNDMFDSEYQEIFKKYVNESENENENEASLPTTSGLPNEIDDDDESNENDDDDEVNEVLNESIENNKLLINSIDDCGEANENDDDDDEANEVLNESIENNKLLMDSIDDGDEIKDGESDDGEIKDGESIEEDDDNESFDEEDDESNNRVGINVNFTDNIQSGGSLPNEPATFLIKFFIKSQPDYPIKVLETKQPRNMNLTDCFNSLTPRSSSLLYLVNLYCYQHGKDTAQFYGTSIWSTILLVYVMGNETIPIKQYLDNQDGELIRRHPTPNMYTIHVYIEANRVDYQTFMNNAIYINQNDVNIGIFTTTATMNKFINISKMNHDETDYSNQKINHSNYSNHSNLRVNHLKTTQSLSLNSGIQKNKFTNGRKFKNNYLKHTRGYNGRDNY